jgi:hypothetical protein
MAEVIDIDTLDDLQVINLSKDKSSRPSVNFGGGIELLMNDKRKNEGGKGNSEIDLDDITDLENDLNELSKEPVNIKVKSKSDIFNSGFKLKIDKSEDDDEKWYDNILIIDLIVFLGAFLFLAIAAGIFYVLYPPVMMAFQT